MSATFEARTIDDNPALLESSYRLRYQVYCLERRFLAAEAYPDQQESDGFDRHSVHVGVVDQHGVLAGTARLVMTSDAGFPLMRYCTLSPDAGAIVAGAGSIIEISRLAVSRLYSRRHTDSFFAGPQANPDRLDHARVRRERRTGADAVFVTLIKAIYQAAKRLGATHWIVATEKSLQRRIVQYGLPFEVAGPERDYLGQIAPYIMSVAAFDDVILAGGIPVLDHFLDGLEPEFQPLPGPNAPTSLSDQVALRLAAAGEDVR